jgi:hypothetical protein
MTLPTGGRRPRLAPPDRQCGIDAYGAELVERADVRDAAARYGEPLPSSLVPASSPSRIEPSL